MTDQDPDHFTAPTGPTCYRRAARLTRQAETMTISTQRDVEEASLILAAAQVWATLANAAALVSDRWVSPLRDHGGHDLLVDRDEGWPV